MATVPWLAACSVPRGHPLLRLPHRSLTATRWAREERTLRRVSAEERLLYGLRSGALWRLPK